MKVENTVALYLETFKMMFDKVPDASHDSVTLALEQAKRVVDFIAEGETEAIEAEKAAKEKAGGTTK